MVIPKNTSQVTGIKQIMQKRFLEDAILVIINEKHFLKSRNRLGKRWPAWELYQIKLNASINQLLKKSS